MKSYYSRLDMTASAEMPSRLQHLVIGEMARQLGGKVSFYVAEDPEFLYEQFTLRARLEARPEVEGIIFLRLKQFDYGASIDVSFMREILDMGYELHFARENLSIRSIADLDACFSTLYAFHALEAPGVEEALYRDLLDADV